MCLSFYLSIYSLLSPFSSISSLPHFYFSSRSSFLPFPFSCCSCSSSSSSSPCNIFRHLVTFLLLSSFFFFLFFLIYTSLLSPTDLPAVISLFLSSLHVLPVLFMHLILSKRIPCLAGLVGVGVGLQLHDGVGACLTLCPATTHYSPVCGSDYVTYTNPSTLKCWKKCRYPGELACLAVLPCLFVRPVVLKLSACLPVCFLICLLVCFLAFLLVCLSACFVACLLSGLLACLFYLLVWLSVCVYRSPPSFSLVLTLRLILILLSSSSCFPLFASLIF